MECRENERANVTDHGQGACFIEMRNEWMADAHRSRDALSPWHHRWPTMRLRYHHQLRRYLESKRREVGGSLQLEMRRHVRTRYQRRLRRENREEENNNNDGAHFFPILFFAISLPPSLHSFHTQIISVFDQQSDDKRLKIELRTAAFALKSTHSSSIACIQLDIVFLSDLSRVVYDISNGVHRIGNCNHVSTSALARQSRTTKGSKRCTYNVSLTNLSTIE